MSKWFRRKRSALIPRLYKEKAGVISEEECWVIFHGMWMYGPTDTMWQCIKQMVCEWKADRHLVG